MTAKLIYLDNASTSSKLPSFVDLLCESYREPSRALDSKVDLLDSLLVKLSNYLGLKKENISLVPSSTYAVNELWSFLLERAQDRLVNVYLLRNDHISNLASILYLQEKKKPQKIVIHYFEASNISSLQLKDNSVVLLTVLDNLGIEGISAEEIEKLREASPSAVLIGDLTQYMPFSLKGEKMYTLFDYFYFSAHKWMGPFGLGVIASTREKLKLGLNNLILKKSGYSLDWRSLYVWESSLSELEDYQREKREIVSQLREYWRDNFPESLYLDYTCSEDSLIFLVGVKHRSWHDLAFWLEKNKIVFRADDFCNSSSDLKGKHLRFSLSTLNSKKEISQLFGALNSFCKLKY